MVAVAERAETRAAFLRRGAVVVTVLVAIAVAAAFLTSRDDTQTARDLCKTAAGTQFATSVGITSADRTGDDSFLVHGTATGRSFTCLVTREPVSDRWEVASVSEL